MPDGAPEPVPPPPIIGRLFRVATPGSRLERIAVLTFAVTAGLLIPLKLLQALPLAPRASLLSLGQTLVIDAALSAAWTLLTFLGGALLARYRLAVRLGVLLHVLVTVALLETAGAGFAWFKTTGALLDWSLFSYGWTHLGELWPMLRSGLTATGWLVLGVAALLGSTPALLAAIGPSVPLLPPPPRLRRWSAAALLGLISAMAGGALTPPPETPELALIRTCVPLALGRDALAELLHPAGAVSGHAVASSLPGTERPTGASLPEELRAPPGPLTISPAPGVERHPSIVLVLLESTRTSATTLFRPSLPTTPNLAALARRGVRFDEMYTVVPHTSKALVATLCGEYPMISMSIDEATPGRLPFDCLPAVLSRAGYRTAMFGAATVTFERRGDLAANLGFAQFFGKEDLNPEGFEETSYLGFEDRVMLEPAARWASQAPGQPFFLSILTLASHHNYRLPSWWPMVRYTPDEAELNAYLNAVRYGDDFMGALLERLEKTLPGGLENVLVVALGDHGEAFREHGLAYHDPVVYEEVVHIPMAMAGPGVGPAGGRIGGLRQQVDLVPTLLRLAGWEISADAHLPGRDLFNSDGHLELFFSGFYKNGAMALRDGDTKVVYPAYNAPARAYNIDRDPEERRDLVMTGEVSGAVLGRARRRMTTWRDGINARYQPALQQLAREALRSSRPTPERPLQVRFGERIDLLGYDETQVDSVHAGGTAEIVLHLACLKPTTDWEVVLRVYSLAGSDNFTLVQRPAAGSFNTEACQPGQYVSERFTLRFPSNFPTGPAKVYLRIRAGHEVLLPNPAAQEESYAVLGDLEVGMVPTKGELLPTQEARPPAQLPPPPEPP